MMSAPDWKRWDRTQWNKELFHHYFAVGEVDSPVTTLAVSAEDLKKVTGDLLANADEVRRHFLKSMRGALQGSNGNKGGAAFKNAMLSNKMHQGIPGVFSFLYLSCLAANEIVENEDAEAVSKKFLGEFREVMENLLNVQKIKVDETLAEMWLFLRDFLTEHETIEAPDGLTWRTRKLILPDPGIETHIGYSKRLVFPSRRDQDHLAEVLKSSMLLEVSPPVELVVSAITKAKNSFSKGFVEAFDEFTEALRSGSIFSNLLQHRFWTAVISTTSNEVLAEETGKSRISLFVQLSGLDQNFQLFATEGALPKNFVSSPLEEFDEWTQRLSLNEEIIDPVDWALNNPSGLGSLGGLVKSGVIPFFRRDDGFLQAAYPSVLHESKWALVRNDCVEAFTTIFASENFSSVTASRYQDWSFLARFEIRALNLEEIEGTSLAKSPILFKRIIRPSLRVLSTFSMGSEFLGWPELLPSIEAPLADAVTLHVNGEEIELYKSGEIWRIKPCTLLGKGIVVANYGESKFVREIKFVDVPVSDDYKTPTNFDAIMIEVNRGMDVFSNYLSYLNSRKLHQIDGSIHQIYLGSIPGEFLNSPDNAVIQVSWFGQEKVVSVVNPAALSISNVKVDAKNLVRNWRKLVEDAIGVLPRDSEYIQILRSMKSKTEGFDCTCDPVGGFDHPPTEYSDNLDNSIKRDVLLAATAARSLRAKGIPIAVWREMLMEHLDLNWKEVRFIHRAWLESGLIDELSSVRYPGLMIFGRKPMMEMFQAGSSFVGAITGLVMPKRLEGLKKFAEERSLITAMNVGPSGLVPPHLRIRADTETKLLNFAADAGLSTKNLASNPFPFHTHRESGPPPYLGYRKRSAHPTFEIPDGVEFAAFESSRGPMFWTASFGGRTAWSYSPAHAEFLACHLAGGANLQRISSVDLTIVSAFVPLYAARWIVAVGGVPSGPDAIGRYTYRFPSPELLDIFIDYYEKEVSEQLSAWHLDIK